MGSTVSLTLAVINYLPTSTSPRANLRTVVAKGNQRLEGNHLFKNNIYPYLKKVSFIDAMLLFIVTLVEASDTQKSTVTINLLKRIKCLRQ